MELRIELYQETKGLSSLVGRENAENLINKLSSNLKHLQEEDKLIVDFDKIETCTISYLDELFGGLKEYLKGRGGVLLLIENITDYAVYMELEALAAYLKAKKGISFAVIYQKGRELSLIGNVDSGGRRVFQLLTKQSLTARELADLEDKEINAASNQLKRLYDAGMALRREIIDTDGKKFVYYLR